MKNKQTWLLGIIATFFVFGGFLIGGKTAMALDAESANNASIEEGIQEAINFLDTLPPTQSKTLPLPESTLYDRIIGNNTVVRTVKGEGAERGLKILTQRGSPIMSLVKQVLAAIAIFWLVYVGFKFTLSQGSEENLGKYKAQFGWILLGLIIMGTAEIVGYDIFDPFGNDVLRDQRGLKNFAKLIERITLFFQIIIGGIALLAGIRSGMALITSGDEDETIENEKRFVKIFIFALALILLAEVIAKGVINFNGAGEANIDARFGLKQVVGLINFVLSFLAWAALFMVVLSSIYYVASFGNDEQASRAKQMIIGSIIGLVLAFSSYTIVRFLVNFS